MSLGHGRLVTATEGGMTDVGCHLIDYKKHHN